MSLANERHTSWKEVHDPAQDSPHHAAFRLLESGRFIFRTLADAENLALFLAHFFPDPQRALPGLGELLVNAIEHGNLGLGYEQKAALPDDGAWRAEIERRQGLPEYAGKYATAIIAHKAEGMVLVIEDQGEGFDWKRHLHINPARAGDKHGRGIARAAAISFDRLTYNPKGNRAVALVSKAQQLAW